MNNELKKLALLLAASDLKEKQLVLLMRGLANYSPEMFVRLVQRLRTLNAAVLDADFDLREDVPSEVSAQPLGTEATVAQIEHLLRYEAGMSMAEAVSKLSRALAREGPVSPALRQTPKHMNADTFRRWLVRLLDTVPASAALHHATLLRNQRVNVRPTDWPLKDRNE